MKRDVYSIRQGAILCGALIPEELAQQLEAIPVSDTALRRLVRGVSEILRFAAAPVTVVVLSGPRGLLEFGALEFAGPARTARLPIEHLTAPRLHQLDWYLQYGEWLSDLRDTPPVLP